MLSFLHSQLIRRLPSPNGTYKGQTVIITGSNVGLGKEAARHFAQLGAKRLILAVRSVEKGETAKNDIQSTLNGNDTTIEVWQLDMASYSSVLRFAARINTELDRVDKFIANAGIASAKYYLVHDNESCIGVNVVSTFLLAALVLPKLKETAKELGIRPTLTVTTSETHMLCGGLVKKAVEAGELFPLVTDKETVETHMATQYPASKLLEVFGVRAIAEQSPADTFPVTINCVNPGLCHSELARDHPSWGFWLMKLLLARSTEVGSRNLVAAATMGEESHGKYVSDCEISTPAPFLETDDGRLVQDMFWRELTDKLEGIKPGVMKAFMV